MLGVLKNDVASVFRHIFWKHHVANNGKDENEKVVDLLL